MVKNIVNIHAHVFQESKEDIVWKISNKPRRLTKV
jgi:hypothetical protein